MARAVFVHRPGRYIPGKVVRCSTCSTLYKRPDDPGLALADLYLGGYEQQFAPEVVTAAETELSDILARIIELRGRTGRVLDIGCGPGHFIRLARDAGFEVYGAELNPALAEACRRATGAHMFMGGKALADAAATNLKFDVVSMLDLIEHLQDPRDLLETVRKLVRPGGLVAVFTPNHASLIVRMAWTLYTMSAGRLHGPVDEIFDSLHVTYFDLSGLTRLLSDCGYRILHTRLTPYRPERRNQAIGIAAAALRTIEAVSPLLPSGPFRMLMLAEPEARSL
jgi:SAM-dependent methyltransferase